MSRNILIRHLDFKLMEFPDEEPCEEDQPSYEAEKEKTWAFNNEVYKVFYLKAIENIKNEMSR